MRPLDPDQRVHAVGSLMDRTGSDALLEAPRELLDRLGDPATNLRRLRSVLAILER
jgi:hypothetical protein